MTWDHTDLNESTEALPLIWNHFLEKQSWCTFPKHTLYTHHSTMCWNLAYMSSYLSASSKMDGEDGPSSCAKAHTTHCCSKCVIVHDVARREACTVSRIWFQSPMNQMDLMPWERCELSHQGHIHQILCLQSWKLKQGSSWAQGHTTHPSDT